MLVVVKVEGLNKLPINDIEAGKEVKIEGQAVSLYFDDKYLEQLEYKASKYDEFFEKQASGYLGHNIESREEIGEKKSFTERLDTEINQKELNELIKNPDKFKCKYKTD